MELISRIDAIVTDNEMATQAEETAEALKQRDMTVPQEDTHQHANPGDSAELVFAEREGIRQRRLYGRTGIRTPCRS